jgi:hypothetical protein
VLGNDADNNDPTYSIDGAQKVNRNQKNWESDVFKGA